MVFDAYARYYDLFYADKDYKAEADWVASHIHAHHGGNAAILDLGCGTGSHAECFARMGHVVHGIDLSERMLARAQQRKTSLPHDIAARLSFDRGDVRTVRTGDTYDVVMSLFHVMSYQQSNADLQAMFRTAAAHLRPGGLFLFDFWYGPAVLKQRPELRVSHREDDEFQVTRTAEPILHTETNIVDVNYTVLVEGKKTSETHRIAETHTMRYLFLPELEYLRQGLFTELLTLAWMSDKRPGEDSWAGYQVLTRNS